MLREKKMKKILTIATVYVTVLSIFSTMIPLLKAQTNAWSEPQQLTGSPEQDYGASMMQDSNGKLWLVWTRSPPSMTGDLWYKTSTNGGKSWSSDDILVPDTLQEAPRTNMFQDSTGRIWVAWTSGQYSPRINWDIYYITSEDGGENWTPRARLTDAPEDDGSPSFIEVSGEVWIVFDKQPLSNKIWYYKLNIETLEKTGPYEVSTESPSRVNTPNTMVDSMGRIWIVWTQDGDVHYKTSIDNGASWSPEVQLTNQPNIETLPSIVEDARGRIIVFYAIYTISPHDPDDILYKITEDGGNTWSEAQELIVDEYHNTTPYVALINGTVWAVWSSDRSGYIDIWISKTTRAPQSEIPFWMQWYFWAIIALGMTTSALVFTTVHYHKKARTPKEVTPAKPISKKEFKVCPNCGARLPVDSAFCGKCGTPLK